MTLAELRTFVETDASDSVLQIMLDAAEEDVSAAVGPDTSDIHEEELDGDLYLVMPRKILSVTSITEVYGGATTTLASDDYALLAGNTIVKRLDTGTHPADGFFGLVTVTYVPADLNRRKRTVVQLVQLELDYRPGAESESIGDMNRGMARKDAERRRILAGLRLRGFA